jgi:hypothetical protein
MMNGVVKVKFANLLEASPPIVIVSLHIAPQPAGATPLESSSNVMVEVPTGVVVGEEIRFPENRTMILFTVTSPAGSAAITTFATSSTAADTTLSFDFKTVMALPATEPAV